MGNSKLLHIKFVEMNCWKCGAKNHIYFVEPYIEDTDPSINFPDTTLWSNDKPSFNSEIIQKIKEHLSIINDNKIIMASIKKRYSHTTQSTYMSFGCTKCDAIFGDFYVNNAECDAHYGDNVICEFDIKIDDCIFKQAETS